MFLNVLPEKAWNFTRISVIPIFTWPPPLETSKKKMFIYDILFWFGVICAISMLLPLSYAVYTCKDPTAITRLLAYTCAVCQVIAKMLVSKIQRTRMQIMNSKIERFFGETTKVERSVLQRYVNKYSLLHVFMTVGFYMASVFVLLKPLMIKSELPVDAKYPFEVFYFPMNVLVYFSQTVVCIQTSSALTADCQIAFLLWLVAVRFESLSLEFQDVNSLYDLIMCIRKHQMLIEFASEVIEVVKYLAGITVTVTGLSIIFACLHLLHKQPLIEQVQFVLIIISTNLELYMCASAANSVLISSFNISNCAYNLNWLGKPLQFQKCILFMMQRCQKPIVVSVKGILPELTLSYYSSFLSASASYFTTLRILLQKAEK